MNLEKYIISGFNGYEEKKWDIEEALKTGNLIVNDYTPLITKIMPGDETYIREYNNGIIAKAKIEDVIKINNIFQIKLGDLEIFDNVLKQRDYFYNISNKNKQSRIIEINSSDVKYIEDRLK